jgi:hypothetical protein
MQEGPFPHDNLARKKTSADGTIPPTTRGGSTRTQSFVWNWAIGLFTPVITALFLSGCASTPSSESVTTSSGSAATTSASGASSTGGSNASLVGIWQEPPGTTEFFFRFTKNGTMSAASARADLDAHPLATANWSLAGGRLSFTALSGPCVNSDASQKIGTYDIAITATTVHFMKVSDGCFGRALIDGETLNRVQ